MSEKGARQNVERKAREEKESETEILKGKRKRREKREIEKEETKRSEKKGR